VGYLLQACNQYSESIRTGVAGEITSGNHVLIETDVPELERLEGVFNSVTAQLGAAELVEARRTGELNIDR
jgi:hypothetical protein